MKPKGKKAAVYAFLLLAACVGLLIDRYCVPAIAAASGRPMKPAVRADVTDDGRRLAIGPPMAAIFAPPRLAAISSQQEGLSQAEALLRDAFTLSERMRRAYQATSEQSEKVREAERQKEVADAREQTEAFAGSHSLKAVFLHPADRWAVVDDRILRVGDEIDGFALRRIGRYEAYFEKDGETVHLKLPRPGGSKGDGNEKR